jgi:nucleotide-binding universal stress UspA family protein
MNDSSHREVNAPPIFERILCGVDGTLESSVAVGQAARLLDEKGELQLVSVANLAQAAHAGMAATHAAQLLEQDAAGALAKAREVAPFASQRLVNGEPTDVLLREAEWASLIAVGTHGHGRARGLLLGTVAARMLRDAPCSVLIARAARDPEGWPRSVVVGVDGSAESAAAMGVGRLIAGRFRATLRAIASTKDQLDAEATQAIAPELEEETERPVDVLVRASDSADVIVVGSRGLHGLKALGSVSERVAHQARASVLVVRVGDA